MDGWVGEWVDGCGWEGMWVGGNANRKTFNKVISERIQFLEAQGAESVSNSITIQCL
jgi:hypothetical protein